MSAAATAGTFAPSVREKNRGAAKARNTVRVQLEMPPRSMERLNALKIRTEASSYAEVIKNALRLYETMLEETESGREFLIKDRSGSISPYRVFLEP